MTLIQNVLRNRPETDVRKAWVPPSINENIPLGRVVTQSKGDKGVATTHALEITVDKFIVV